MTKEPSTYLDHATASAELEAQGRFKKQTESKVVTGVPTYPNQPSNSPWHSDPVPPEPPLEIIEFVGKLGGASPVLPSVETAPDREGSFTPSDPPPFPRRRRL
jgi:hypothetical protein